MSIRGLVVALLCGVLGLGLGSVVAYAVQPHAADSGDALPMSEVSPRVPKYEPTHKPYAPDIRFPTLSPDLPLPLPDRTIGNDLATWTYHVPAGWQAYAVCSSPGECPPPMEPDTPLTPRQALRQPEVRFRPPDEPAIGGYSLRVKAVENTLGLNPGQMVSTKIEGFKQAYSEFKTLRRTGSAVYFTYRDGNNRLRYDFFQWFAAADSTTATLEMSVAGRKQDAPGLRALFNRFADNVIGTSEPYRPPKRTPTAGATPSP